MKRAKTMMKTTHLWSQEDEEQLIRKLVNNFCDLINRSEEGGLYWTGLKCDLIELAHIVWETGQLTDHQGRLMDFQSIVWHICRVLHVRVPCNPSSVVSSLARRTCEWASVTLPAVDCRCKDTRPDASGD